jgi:hypothetical protein
VADKEENVARQSMPRHADKRRIRAEFRFTDFPISKSPRPFHQECSPDGQSWSCGFRRSLEDSAVGDVVEPDAPFRIAGRTPTQPRIDQKGAGQATVPFAGSSPRHDVQLQTVEEIELRT